MFAPWLKLGASSVGCRGCGGRPAALAAEGSRAVRHGLDAHPKRKKSRTGPAGLRTRAHGALRERLHACTRRTPRTLCTLTRRTPCVFTLTSFVSDILSPVGLCCAQSQRRSLLGPCASEASHADGRLSRRSPSASSCQAVFGVLEVDMVGRRLAEPPPPPCATPALPRPARPSSPRLAPSQSASPRSVHSAVPCPAMPMGCPGFGFEQFGNEVEDVLHISSSSELKIEGKENRRRGR